MSSSDPFSAQFDSIEIDPSRAPTQAALDHAFALVAPAAAAPEFQTPGFYLLDDCGGRFEVDKDFGVISLKDESILAAEQGAVHTARLRIVEQSGSSYEIDMQLRLTGRVPQMVGADEFAHLATLATSSTPVSAPRAATIVQRTTPWSRFAIAADIDAAAPLGSEDAAFGTLLSTELPSKVGTSAYLILSEAPPAPAARGADWSL